MRHTVTPTGWMTIRLFEAPGQALHFARGGLATLAAAESVRRMGRKGDEVLIHINPKEFRELISRWGEPSVNPYTGLPEYGFLSKAFKKVKRTVKKVGRAIKSVVKSPLFRAVAPILLNFIVPGLGVAVGSALGATGAAAGIIGNAVVQGAIGAATGGTKGAIAGALTGGLGGSGGALAKGIGSTLGTSGAASGVLSGALLGGASSKIQGGSFSKGALTGGALSAAAPYLKNALTGSTDATLTSDGLFQDAAIPPTATTAALASGAGDTSMAGPPAPGGMADPGMVGPPAPDGNMVDGVDFSQGPPAEFATPGATTPAPAAPTGIFDRAIDYAKKNPLKVGLGALTVANALGRSAPQVEAPQVPQVPLPASFTRPLPIVPFNRSQTVQPLSSYYNYGTMPEKVWFQNNQLPPPNDEDDENTMGMAMGGDVDLEMGEEEPQGPLSMMAQQSSQSPYVEGEGTGREDLIDAKLSDGEYVIDAETVAMLGDGSSKAGAARLDEMRAALRRHKAKGLNRGQMSPNAKSPLQYLNMSKGGKAKKRRAA